MRSMDAMIRDAYLDGSISWDTARAHAGDPRVLEGG
jgi:hypothetical protein